MLSRSGIFLRMKNGLFKIWDVSSKGLIVSKHAILNETLFLSCQESIMKEF